MAHLRQGDGGQPSPEFMSEGWGQVVNVTEGGRDDERPHHVGGMADRGRHRRGVRALSGFGVQPVGAPAHGARGRPERRPGPRRRVRDGHRRATRGRSCGRERPRRRRGHQRGHAARRARGFGRRSAAHRVAPGRRRGAALSGRRVRRRHLRTGRPVLLGSGRGADRDAPCDGAGRARSRQRLPSDPLLPRRTWRWRTRSSGTRAAKRE